MSGSGLTLCEQVGRYHEMSAGLVIGGKDVREEQSRITGMLSLIHI